MSDLLRRKVRPAFTLSGGMDSSSVLACAVELTGSKQHAFSSVYTDKTFDEKADSKYDFFGAPVVIDKKSELYLEDAKLDFINGLERSGFHLDIPAAKKTCGCGSSYQF